MHKVGMHNNVRSAFWYLCIKVSINFIQNTLLGSLGRNKICYSDQFVRMSLNGTFEEGLHICILMDPYRLTLFRFCYEIERGHLIYYLMAFIHRKTVIHLSLPSHIFFSHCREICKLHIYTLLPTKQ